jgi:hypothetical protein
MNLAFLYIAARLRSGYDEYMQQEFRSIFSILPRSGETRQPATPCILVSSLDLQENVVSNGAALCHISGCARLKV